MRLQLLSERVLFPLVFIGPGLLFLALFVAFPIGYSFYISFHDMFLPSRQPPTWAGLGNYSAILSDPIFWESTRITAIFTAAVTVTSTIAAFGLALLFNTLRFKPLFLSLIILPITIPPIVVGLIFRIVFDQQFGIANWFASGIGLDPPGWLSNPDAALGTLIAVGVWESIPLSVVIFMAGLQTIPEDALEAARIDGADGMRQLWFIVLPILKPVSLAVIILTTITSIKQFDIAYSLTAGGPGTSTLTMTFYAYNTGFGILQIGRAAAASILIFLAILATVSLLTAAFRDRRRYG